MSHFATIETQIKDIEALRSACKELGLEVVNDADARGYSTNRIHGEQVIKLKGPYDIAVNPNTDGTFGLTCDWYQGHVVNEVGENYGRLLQLYAVHKAIREAKRKGLTTRRQKLEDGSIKLTIGGV